MKNKLLLLSIALMAQVTGTAGKALSEEQRFHQAYEC